MIHHSDQGIQYAGRDYQKLLRQNHIVPSMSRKGVPYDNACAETFFSTIKLEMIYREHYTTREQMRFAIFEYIEVYYNRRRRSARHRQHSTNRIPSVFLSAAGGIARNPVIFSDFNRLCCFFVCEKSRKAQQPVLSLLHQPFTAPIMTPFSKYFWIKGYTQSTGTVETMMTPNLIWSANC